MSVTKCLPKRWKIRQILVRQKTTLVVLLPLVWKWMPERKSIVEELRLFVKWPLPKSSGGSGDEVEFTNQLGQYWQTAWKHRSVAETQSASLRFRWICSAILRASSGDSRMKRRRVGGSANASTSKRTLRRHLLRKSAYPAKGALYVISFIKPINTDFYWAAFHNVITK